METRHALETCLAHNPSLLSPPIPTEVTIPSSCIPSFSLGEKRRSPESLSTSEFSPANKRRKPVHRQRDRKFEAEVTPIFRKISADKNHFKDIVHHFTGKHTLSASSLPISTNAQQIDAGSASCFSCHRYSCGSLCGNVAVENFISQSLQTLQAVIGHLALLERYNLPSQQHSIASSVWRNPVDLPCRKSKMERLS
ncbi:hypothetical protein KP509_36G045400 [Ceratopteris richardii]|uniref:VQ domain-containing protein n=1 Tax=Ceratopteris richardii TaxID=49495 RepID=A0A8T2QCG9_CERRI|nr:hypothetical protein KP509_36G045400 [Ceratopteris richardii]